MHTNQDQNNVEQPVRLPAEFGGTLAPVSRREVDDVIDIELPIGPMDPYATQKGLIVLFGGLVVVLAVLWASGIVGVPGGDTGIGECTRTCESIGAVMGSFDGGHCTCVTP